MHGKLLQKTEVVGQGGATSTEKKAVSTQPATHVAQSSGTAPHDPVSTIISSACARMAAVMASEKARAASERLGSSRKSCRWSRQSLCEEAHLSHA